MPPTIQLLDDEEVTFEDAKKLDLNVIQHHEQVALATQLYGHLWSNRKTIATIIKQQLGLENEALCRVALPKLWIRGGFNVCIPVEVKSRHFSKTVIMRCPMPFKLGESSYPGTVEEKLRAEVGAYAWLQENCPDIRIPQLYGFRIADHHVWTLYLSF